MDFLVVGAGGFIGAISRYSFYLLERSLGFKSFPVATLIINVLGCVVAGILFGITERALPQHRNFLLFATMGFTGSFTTFSTLSIETFQLMKSNLIYALLNVVANIVLGILAVYLSKSFIQTI